MVGRRIILRATIFFAGVAAVCDMLAQTYESTGPMFAAPSVDCSTSQPVFVETPSADCSSSQPMVLAPPDLTIMVQPTVPMGTVPMNAVPMNAVPGAMVPPGMVYPSAEAGIPMPGAVPSGPVPGPFASIAPGGALSPRFGLPAGPQMPQGSNTVQVPVANDEAAWEQIVGVVTEYFPIAREQQARRSGAAWAEGRIETAYEGGATIFEPFRKDSVGSYNRWESTFQTIRRIAVVRVIPDAVGFQVEVVVEKELEDLPRPENSTAGSAVFRTISSLPSPRQPDVSRQLSSPRWIPLGRDPVLEAKIAADIQTRFVPPPPDSSWSVFGW